MPKNRFQLWTITCLSTIALMPSTWAIPQHNNWVANAPPPPTDQGAPRGRSQGGASRGNCEQYQQLTALVPTVEGRVWGLTASEHPAFWFYLPSALTTNVSIEFVLQDKADRELYRTQFTPTDTQPGLIQLKVPETAPAIEPGQSYVWTLAIYCDPDQPSELVFVQGSIQRTSLTTDQQRQIAAAAPLERSRLYSEFGLWYDALATLGDLRQTNSAQTEAAWNALLQRAELEAVSNQPIVSCCTPQ